MLLLAKHARLWRRSEEIERKQLVRESLRRWAHLRRQGRLRPLSLALTPTARLALLAAGWGGGFGTMSGLAYLANAKISNSRYFQGNNGRAY